MPRPLPATFALAAPAPGVHLIRVRGTFDLTAAARLLRLVEARLQLVASAGTRTERIVVELDPWEGELSGLALLSHVRRACERRGVSFGLAGEVWAAALPDDVRPELSTS